MKNIKTLLLLLSVSLFISSCSLSACDCVEIYESRYSTYEDIGECTKKFNTTGTLGESSALESAKKNYYKECND